MKGYFATESSKAGPGKAEMGLVVKPLSDDEGS